MANRKLIITIPVRHFSFSLFPLSTFWRTFCLDFFFLFARIYLFPFFLHIHLLFPANNSSILLDLVRHTTHISCSVNLKMTNIKLPSKSSVRQNSLRAAFPFKNWRTNSSLHPFMFATAP